jgi:hypothetical protein
VFTIDRNTQIEWRLRRNHPIRTSAIEKRLDCLLMADNRVGGRPLWSSEIPRAGIWRRIFEAQFFLRAQP